MLQHLTHAKLVKEARRPPGMIADHPCQGMLRIPAGDSSRLDAAQPREGQIGEQVFVDLLECQGCGHCLPVALGRDGKQYLRNDYNPSATRWVAPVPLSKDR